MASYLSSRLGLPTAPAAGGSGCYVAAGAADSALARSHNVSSALVAAQGPQGYVLDVTSGGAALLCAGVDAAGCFYAAVTLVAATANHSAPLGRVVDSPSTPWRGTFLVHDSQLQWPSLNVTYVEVLVDYLAALKLNYFVLHSNVTLALTSAGASSAPTYSSAGRPHSASQRDS